MGVTEYRGKLQSIPDTSVETDVRQPYEHELTGQQRTQAPGKQAQRQRKHVAVNGIVKAGRALTSRTQISEKRDIRHQKQESECPLVARVDPLIGNAPDNERKKSLQPE